MSVEQLLDKGESAAIIDGEKKRVEETSGVKSPVHIIASVYIHQAADAIKSMSRKYDRPHEEAGTQDDFMKRLTPIDRGVVHLNHAGLILGICLNAIEDSIIERVVVGANIAAEYNMAVSGTPFEVATHGEDSVEQIPADKWRKMIACVKEDPTFGTFFTDEAATLPESVRQTLNSSGMRVLIAQRIIPAYSEQVRTLIAQNRFGS